MGDFYRQSILSLGEEMVYQENDDLTSIDQEISDWPV